MALLDEIATKLAALGCGTVGTTIYKGAMPATPDACCTIYETPGLAPEYSFGEAAPTQETPGIQVVFRGAPDDYATPRALAQTAFDGLSAVMVESLSGTAYHWIQPTGSPFLFRRDENRRPYIAINFLAEREL